MGSIVSFTAMVVLLSQFNGKPVFTWNGVTLNAVVAILSVTIKANIAYVVSECMAQWKWIMFIREPRLLIDFDRLDAATRGPLGSLRVLFKTKSALAVRFGAVLTLVAVGLDPFAQQLVQLRNSLVFTESRSEDSGPVALTSRAPFYGMGSAVTVSNNGTPYCETELHLSMQAAILNGFSRSPWEIEREALTQCPTSNCTWEPFNTVGVCHRCNDITSDLELVGGFRDIMNMERPGRIDNWKDIDATAFALPNGHYFAYKDGCPPYTLQSASCKNGQGQGWSSNGREGYAATFFGTGNPYKTNSMRDIETLIWSTSLIYPDVEAVNKSSPIPVPWLFEDSYEPMHWPDVPMQAMECAIYYCVKTVHATVQGNQLSEHVTEAKEFKPDPNSWLGSDSGSYGSEEIPPDGKIGSMEYHPVYSTAYNSTLFLRDLSNETSDIFRIKGHSVKSISHYMQDLFLANWPNATDVRKAIQKKLGKDAVGFNGALEGPLSDHLDMNATPPALQGLWSWSRTNFSGHFYTLATSMTNEMRRNYDPELKTESGQERDRYQDGSMNFYGKVGKSSVLYDVRWPWLAAHASMLVCAIIFLFITLGSSGDPSTVPLAKNSSLATIRHGYHVGGVLESSNTVEHMQKTAREAYVKLPQGDDDEGTPCSRRQEREKRSEPCIVPVFEGRGDV
ncbi:hypothetical protein FZEAL_4493 [Fusarium zealandicum]|uniref:Uncharacterized protein n=1 Tax=Fusarium zealandicum TaxID=1053134 RepID=A0A8H4XKR0_9HYPO|nr:hypothetical protein FZEAL_4493 [Fusarium zealandicum]